VPATKRTPHIGDLVDELGDIGVTLAPVRSHIAREDALRKALRAAVELAPPEEPQEIQGKRWTAYLGRCGPQRKVNIASAAKILGLKGLVKVASVTLKALQEAYAAGLIRIELDMLHCIEETPTGTRTLEVFPK
jgi:hypothetical protein